MKRTRAHDERDSDFKYSLFILKILENMLLFLRDYLLKVEKVHSLKKIDGCHLMKIIYFVIFPFVENN